MPSTESPEIIVARYLKSNNYTDTYKAFVQEAGLRPDAGSVKPGDWTIEKILDEKKQFDASLNYEKVQEDGANGWTCPAPRKPILVTPPSGTANVLRIATVRSNRDISEKSLRDTLLISIADRSIHAVLLKSDYSTECVWKGTGASPTLSIIESTEGGFYTTEMSGTLTSWVDNEIKQPSQIQFSRQDHSKYAVDVAVIRYHGRQYIATAGWDQRVLVYCRQMQSSQAVDNSELETPIATLAFQTNPECLHFAIDPDSDVLFLLISRRDSTHLYYYILQESAHGSPSVNCFYAGRQNLAPNSNAWIAFSPSHFIPHPSDPTLLAIATNQIPHMKLLVVRLLFPPSSPDTSLPGGLVNETTDATPFATSSSVPSLPVNHYAARARDDLLLQNRESSAIILQTNTSAPQTPYSTPQCAWRPDGSGVWVNGDDGAVRGIEITTGKVVAVLGPEKQVEGEMRLGHEAGMKVRSLWAGTLEGWGEVVVSGAFDRRVIIWRVEGTG